MSYEIGYNDPSLAGSTDVRAVIFEDQTMANVSNGSAFVPFVLASIASYMLTMSDRTGRGHFRLTVPAHINATGVRPIEFMESSGSHLGNFDLQWSGSTLVNLPSLRADVQQVSTVILADLDQIHIHAEDTATRVLKALPNADPAATGGLITVGTGSGQIAAASGSVAVSDFTASSAADTIIDAIKAKTDLISTVYHALLQFTRDQSNTQDEYTVQWFKDGSPVTSGITVPTIQVVKRADGTDLVASSAMTQIGSTGSYKFTTAVSGERVTKGEAAIAVLSATIDGSPRPWRVLVGRDSA